jgi:hypothetical protein
MTILLEGFEIPERGLFQLNLHEAIDITGKEHSTTCFRICRLTIPVSHL